PQPGPSLFETNKRRDPGIAGEDFASVRGHGTRVLETSSWTAGALSLVLQWLLMLKRSARRAMNSYVTSLPPVLALSSGQNSLQGALKSVPEPLKRTSSTSSKSPNLSAATAASDATAKHVGPTSSLDQDMQRQLADYNRSITVVVWYRAGTEPIRLQHMNATFPYFQLIQLDMLVKDLALSPNSFIDTYDPQSGTWEQHTMNTVRIVCTQQRVLYRIRRSLLNGLSEHECPGLQEEVAAQSSSPSHPSHPPKSEHPHSTSVPLPRKRSAADESPSEPAQKVHIPNHYYSPHTPSPLTVPQAAVAPLPITEAQVYVNGYPAYSSQMYYASASAPPVTAPAPVVPPSVAQTASTSAATHATPSTPAPATSVSLPQPDATLSPDPSAVEDIQLPSPSIPMPPIPYHTHPPLKRWPNDYTVSELTNGFRAMEALVRDGGGRTGVGAMTQRSAFERVFGSRYVKSTVCRHRGVWRKAAGPLREQFERMGTDERACWGEFVRRVEGRPPGKAVQVQAQMQIQGGGVYSARAGAEGLATSENRAQPDVVPPDEPAMASLQDPDSQGTTTFS
ncbi:hypothetical protein H0H87_009463, partial [Tephrocybe sp. NHM501043]